MLTTRLGRVGIVVAGGALACAGVVATPSIAHAQASDAVDGCGAYNVHDGVATVPGSSQSATLFSVNTSEGTFPIKCGNGTTYGAVHIEVKHNVPNWADALSCITKTINRTSGVPGDSGKTTYTYSPTSGTKIVVVRGNNGIITAYPKGGSVSQKWQTCSAS